MRALFVLMAVTLASHGEGRVIHNAGPIVEQEWVETRTITVSASERGAREPVKRTVSQTFILSLRPGDHWHTGTAWILRTDQSAGGAEHRAWKGTYQFFTVERDKDLLLLQIGFLRKYTGTPGGAGIEWQLDTRYEPKGVSLEIPIEDDTLPKDRLTLSVTRAFFVDGDGKETVKRYAPDTLLEKLAGQGEVKALRSVDFAAIGQTLKLQPKDVRHEDVVKNPPPGFKVRK